MGLENRGQCKDVQDGNENDQVGMCMCAHACVRENRSAHMKRKNRCNWVDNEKVIWHGHL